MTAMDRIRPFDYRAGLVTVEAGISIDALLRFVLPRGWFPAVSPGTGFATIGGAIANDVHGKNHPSARGFVRSIRILTPDLGVVIAEPQRHSDLFWATAGGLGLTGIVLEATLQLMRVPTAQMRSTPIAPATSTRCSTSCGAMLGATGTRSPGWTEQPGGARGQDPESLRPDVAELRRRGARTVELAEIDARVPERHEAVVGDIFERLGTDRHRSCGR
jgi:hypothetical protein